MATKPTTTTRIIPLEKLSYEKMVTLKHHVVDVKESTQGVLTVAIIPRTDNVMDSTVIMHQHDEDVVRVSTSREMRTDARTVTKMVDF